jgi:hypothetical protein
MTTTASIRRSDIASGGPQSHRDVPGNERTTPGIRLGGSAPYRGDTEQQRRRGDGAEEGGVGAGAEAEAQAVENAAPAEQSQAGTPAAEEQQGELTGSVAEIAGQGSGRVARDPNAMKPNEHHATASRGRAMIAP